MVEVDESVVEIELEFLWLILDIIYYVNDLIDDEMSILNVKVLKKIEEWENYRGYVFLCMKLFLFCYSKEII